MPSRHTHTLVVGVDDRHLRQLAMTWPTWKRFKPGLLDWPMIVFYDKDQVSEYRVRKVVDHPNLRTVAWPFKGMPTRYKGGGESKWNDPQRYKMLAGFVYVPAAFVRTDYWLKIDTDVVACGMEDWIKDEWFDDRPAIVAHRWGFTKPPDQMVVLDKWAETLDGISDFFCNNSPLNLKPEPDSTRLGHKRIISWCAFFDSIFSRFTASLAATSCGPGLLPVASQDGYQWYCAKRLGRGIVRVNMKVRGWKHKSSESSIRKAIDSL